MSKPDLQQMSVNERQEYLLRNMMIHEVIRTSISLSRNESRDLVIMRVVSGWIYSSNGVSVFVPEFSYSPANP